MSEKTRRNLDMFWELIDEILNAILFVLIGMTVLLLPRDGLLFGVALLTIPMCLLCRFIAVGVPISLLGMRRKFTPHAVKILAWGGLRGGISVALALWLSQLLGKEHTLSRNVILMSTYAVVFFSIVVQGLTIGPLLKRLGLIQGDGSDQPATE
jgi:CPA1 family monovalent cation:H+ antiporter